LEAAGVINRLQQIAIFFDQARAKSGSMINQEESP